ncbi:carboxypeptidase-like regulatory domain-containing protein [Flavobacterium sp. 3-210]
MIKKNKDGKYVGDKIKVIFSCALISLAASANADVCLGRAESVALEVAGRQRSDIITIKGRVTDQYGKPLNAVKVLLKERARIVQTDSNGDYIIAAKIKENLEFSSTGFISKKVRISGEVLNIKLKKE